MDVTEVEPALAITVILLSLLRIVFRRLFNECEYECPLPLPLSRCDCCKLEELLLLLLPCL